VADEKKTFSRKFQRNDKGEKDKGVPILEGIGEARWVEGNSYESFKYRKRRLTEFWPRCKKSFQGLWERGTEN